MTRVFVLALEVVVAPVKCNTKDLQAVVNLKIISELNS
jgi:hypothetical protein